MNFPKILNHGSRHTPCAVRCPRRAGAAEIFPILNQLCQATMPMSARALGIIARPPSPALFRKGRCVATRQSALYENPDLGTIQRAIADVAGESGSEGAGVCLPGVMNASTGKVIQSVNLPAIVGADMGRLVRGALGLPRH